MSSAKPVVKRTYGLHSRRTYSTNSSSSDASFSSSPSRDTTTTSPTKRKRPLLDTFLNCAPAAKKPALYKPKKSKQTTEKLSEKKKAEVLTQLHFITEESTLRTCELCDLSYTRGAPDDEALHKAHCARVQKGMEWTREDDRETDSGNGVVTLVAEDVDVGKAERGRIIAVKPTAASKAATKISGYLKTVNLALSAPDTTRASLETSKAYLFLLRERGSTKEKIVGCVLAQRITSAMRIASKAEVDLCRKESKPIIHVEGDLYCTPQRHPTPMGIPRLFVSSAHRRKGIASALLSTAAKTFIHGCELSPRKGEVAFSQPTSMGRTVMENWGRGGVRVYEE